MRWVLGTILAPGLAGLMRERSPTVTSSHSLGLLESVRVHLGQIQVG